MKRMRLARILLVVLALVACRPPAGISETSSRSETLGNLENLDEFVSAFNRDRGIPRVVLLLSPT